MSDSGAQCICVVGVKVHFDSKSGVVDSIGWRHDAQFCPACSECCFSSFKRCYLVRDQSALTPEKTFTFSFVLFLIYMFFLFLRPIELFAQWLVAYRPMFVIWVFAFGTSFVHVLRHKDAAAKSVHYLLLFCLCLAIAFSLLFSGWAGAVTFALSDFSSSALLFVLISFNARDLKRLRATCWVILFCLVTLSAMGIYAYHTGNMAEELVLQQAVDNDRIEVPKERPPVPALDTSGAFMWRVRGVGFFNDPNDFAQTLVMSMPMLWWFYRKGRHIRNLLFVLFPGAVMGYAIALTNSRGALLGVASLMFFGVRDALGTIRTTILLAVLAVGSMVANVTGGRGFDSKESSAEGRIDAWYDGFQMLKMSPLFGVGYGNFTEYHELTAHNSFVLCFAELGLFGYFVWISLVVLAFKSVQRVVDNAPMGSEERQSGVILRASLVGYLTCAWFLSRTYQPVLYTILALCSAVWCCSIRNPTYKDNEGLLSPMLWRTSAFITMIVSMSAVYGFITMHFMKH